MITETVRPDGTQSVMTMTPLMRSLIRVFGILLILSLGMLQGLGYFLRLEYSLLVHLPEALLPPPPRVLLISLEATPHGNLSGFQPMDVAMILRGLSGLGQLHPRCIVLDGIVEKEENSVHLLPDIIARLRTLPGIEFIQPQHPSSTALFQFVPLVRYAPFSQSIDWLRIEGRAAPGKGDAFLLRSSQVLSHEDSYTIPLFAKTIRADAPVGSLWWWALPVSCRKNPPVLFYNTTLFLNNHSLIALSPQGDFIPSSEGSIQEMPLDDFLVAVEKKDQGTISPTFDSLWNDAIVVLGTHADVAQATALAALLQETAWRHFSLMVQALMTSGWIVLFLLFKKVASKYDWILSAVFFTSILGVTALLIHYGIIFPFLPGIAAALMLPLNKR